MTRTWHINKKQLQKTAAILFAMALLFGLFAFAHWFGALIALIAAVAGVHSLIVAQNTKPVLTIGPEGLRYARFSERTVPWDRIDEVAVVRGMQRGAAWGKVVYRPQPQMDEINFSSQRLRRLFRRAAQRTAQHPNAIRRPRRATLRRPPRRPDRRRHRERNPRPLERPNPRPNAARRPLRKNSLDRHPAEGGVRPVSKFVERAGCAMTPAPATA